MTSRFRSCIRVLLILVAAVLAGIAPDMAQASGLAPLGVIAPVTSCESLQALDLSGTIGASVTLSSAQSVSLDGARYCIVKGTIAPAIGFETRLPQTGWTQRFLQVGCGGLCGSLSIRVEHAEGCIPADTHQLVLASTDMGHEAQTLGDGSFGKAPQKRIDFAYRGVHLAALASQALIRRYYGQPARFSYFSGCSDGGREGLMEAQRFPADFDGVAAGAPAMNFLVQNTFYHAWMYASNHDAAGRAILLADRLPLFHRVVLAQCDALDGLKDGLISDPRACHLDLAAAQCRPSQPSDTCLTAAEIAVARKFYQGPRDDAGRRFTIGGPQPGSELAWAGVYVPRRADEDVMSRSAALDTLKYLAFPINPPEAYTLADFKFDQATFARLATLHPLYDATDTDLSGFARRGGKLLLWHGWSDPHISPINTIAYYQGVQKQLGETRAAAMMRLFLFPGLYHCGGGDGFSQFDVLTPLMAWVETGAAPDRIVAGQTAFDTPPMGPPPGGHAGPPGARMGPPPEMKMTPPALKARRPVYAFPTTASYAGTGDAADAASWSPSAPSGLNTDRYDWEGAAFMAPDFHKSYTVKDDRLVAGPAS